MAEIVHHGPKCSWRQRGNLTGHCSGCCRTFDTLSAFDAHQAVVDGRVVCSDPATMTRSDGSPRYQSRTDDVAEYWALVPTDAQLEAHARFIATVRAPSGNDALE